MRGAGECTISRDAGAALSLEYNQIDAHKHKPALHALIIGVSEYPYLPKRGEAETTESFGMTKLSSPALAAYRIFEWLTAPDTKHPVPLASCRMLLCPSPEEIAAEPKLAGFTAPWGIDQVVADAAAWRADAGESADSRTLFYFAGHGARRTQRDCVMLLPQFGMPGGGGTLARCVDTRTLRDGMAPAPSFPNIARTQLYFVDACRILPQKFRQFESLPTYAIFNVEVNDIDDRKAPLFYAAIPGTAAIGLAGEQTLFSRALLQCLSGAAGEPMEEDQAGTVSWRVSVASLNEALGKIIANLNNELGTDQLYEPGASAPAEICHLPAPPKVRLTLRLNPDSAANVGNLVVKNYQGMPVWQLPAPLSPLPLTGTLEAGAYAIDISFNPANPGFINYHRLKMVLPPRMDLVARCTN
jgi:hypothetical protein